MSILSKIFILLVTILAVLLAALIIPFVSNVEDYRAQRELAEQERDVAKVAIGVAQEALVKMRSAEATRIAEKQAEVTLLEGQIGRLKNELANMQTQLIAANNKNVKFEADLGRLSAADAQKTTLLASTQNDLNTIRDQRDQFRQKTIELAGTNTDLESRVQVLNRQVRSQRETIAEQEERAIANAELLSRIPVDVLERAKNPNAADSTADAGDESTSRIEMDPPVSGKVTLVSNDGGITFVQIDLGKVDGVRPNVLFRVHRGSQFLGRLVISAVDEKSAAGRIELAQGTAIAIGDRVQSGGAN